MDREITPAQRGCVNVGDRKGGVMRSIWVGVPLSLLSIIAYNAFSDAPGSPGQALSEVPAPPSIAANPPSPTPVGAIALDAPSGRPAPGSTDNDGNLPVHLATYVFLHRTSSENLSAPNTMGLNVPWHWLRIYAVTPRPTENR